jgi:hypothetical protein
MLHRPTMPLQTIWWFFRRSFSLLARILSRHLGCNPGPICCDAARSKFLVCNCSAQTLALWRKQKLLLQRLLSYCLASLTGWFVSRGDTVCVRTVLFVFVVRNLPTINFG